MQANPFRFPRLRFWLLRQLNRLKRPEQPTEAEIQGRINVEVAERARASGPLTNAQEHSHVWIDPLVEMSPEPSFRFTEPFEQAQAMLDAGRRRRAIQRWERAPQTHELPALPRPLRAYIDAQSNDTPPKLPAWNCFVVPAEEDEGEPTGRVEALPASEQLRYWANRKMV